MLFNTAVYEIEIEFSVFLTVSQSCDLFWVTSVAKPIVSESHFRIQKFSN